MQLNLPSICSYSWLPNIQYNISIIGESQKNIVTRDIFAKQDQFPQEYYNFLY